MQPIMSSARKYLIVLLNLEFVITSIGSPRCFYESLKDFYSVYLEIEAKVGIHIQYEEIYEVLNMDAWMLAEK